MSKEKTRFLTKFESESLEVVNEEFSKIKIYVQTAGENRNNSFMSKETIENALPSMKYVPIVAEYFQPATPDEDGKFGSHGGRIIMDDNGTTFEQTTKPYGLVPHEYNPRWEMQVDNDGIEREYLVVDGLVWSGRYEDLSILENNDTNQSMEINADGSFNEDGMFEITEFSYSALCLLGSDVEPCFSKARVETYSLEDTSEYEEMLKKYQEFVNKPVVEEESPEVSEEEFEANEPEVEETNVEPKTFELTYQQRYELLNKAVNKTEENWAWLRDFTTDWAIYEVESRKDDEWQYNNFKVGYTIEGEEVTLTEEKVEVFATWVTQEQLDAIEAEKVEFAKELKELNEKVETIEEELNKTTLSLGEYQAKEAEEIEAQRKLNIDEVIADFDKDLGNNEEFNVIKQNAYGYENAEVLENELLLIYARNNRKGNTNKKEVKSFSVVSVEINEEPITKQSRYGEAEKYFNKNEEE